MRILAFTPTKTRAFRCGGRSLPQTVASDAHATLLWRGRLPPGAMLELRGFSGDVRVDARDDATAEVVAVRSGPRAASIEFRVVEHPHGVSIYAGSQDPEPGDVRLASGTALAAVNLLARVPPGLHVAASTEHGNVEVVGVAGNVEAGSTNGRVILLPAAG